jgi:predicted tellurium resistance membrane protein TerC
MFDWIAEPQAWIALGTLTALEIVLGVDNVIFISILAGKLPPDQQEKARKLGLVLAMGMRILLLMSLSWVAKLTETLFTVLEHSISGRDLILIGGGLFLLAKSTREIHLKMEGADEDTETKVYPSFVNIIVQIVLLDIVFSLDSVITAVGMSNDLGVMVLAVVIAVLFMMAFAKPVSDFVERHPTVKILALSFLLLIGFTLVAQGFGHEIPKGYIYFAMAFSVFVESLNLRLRKPGATPVKLKRQV